MTATLPDGHPSVRSVVQADLASFLEHATGRQAELVGLVIADLGRVERAGDGRDSLLAAYDEALDLLCCLRQAAIDGNGTALLFSSVRSVALDLRGRLFARDAPVS